ncbi:NAD(P)H-hydrate epimerase [Corynebacterium sp.]|uniref:NAD(P)H-hydrate epimerase n=1 Tax=Corynebacterium sp. TaxID=1720 RepID=UPI0026DCADA8|nr:NAD(P)H-hydrate epimerase [Corynebacterium sp.]MDO5077073.1 NAD(P)H-hydrate epimerase [Corynebacterium sp.]
MEPLFPAELVDPLLKESFAQNGVGVLDRTHQGGGHLIPIERRIADVVVAALSGGRHVLYPRRVLLVAGSGWRGSIGLISAVELLGRGIAVEVFFAAGGSKQLRTLEFQRYVNAGGKVFNWLEAFDTDSMGVEFDLAVNALDLGDEFEYHTVLSLPTVAIGVPTAQWKAECSVAIGWATVEHMQFGGRVFIANVPVESPGRSETYGVRVARRDAAYLGIEGVKELREPRLQFFARSHVSVLPARIGIVGGTLQRRAAHVLPALAAQRYAGVEVSIVGRVDQSPRDIPEALVAGSLEQVSGPPPDCWILVDGASPAQVAEVKRSGVPWWDGRGDRIISPDFQVFPGPITTIRSADQTIVVDTELQRVLGPGAKDVLLGLLAVSDNPVMAVLAWAEAVAAVGEPWRFVSGSRVVEKL